MRETCVEMLGEGRWNGDPGPMVVCHVITRMIRGGADENTLLSCNAQVAAGQRVHLIYGAEYDREFLATLDPKVIRHCVKSMRRAIHPALDFLGLFEIGRIIKAIRPDVVHTHTSKAGVLGRVAAWRAEVPIIVHGVHIIPFLSVGHAQRVLYRWIERRLVHITTAFVDVSQGMRDSCIAEEIGREDQHYVVASGMDLSKFMLSAEEPVGWAEVLASHKVRVENPLFLLLVSRLEPRKRQADFLNVFAKVVQRVPQAVLILAGEGPDDRRIRNRIHELALAENVIWTGFRVDVDRLMKIASIGIISSVREGLPRVAVQYVAAGLPVVATALPGIEQVVRPGENGILVDAGDLTAMEEPLVRLLRDEGLRKSMSARSRGLDLREWSTETMCTRLDEIYRHLRAKRAAQLESERS